MSSQVCISSAIKSTRISRTIHPTTRRQLTVLILVIAVRLSPAPVIGGTFPTVVDLHGYLILPKRLHQVGEVIHFACQVYAARRSRRRSAMDRKVVASEGPRAGVGREPNAVVAP